VLAGDHRSRQGAASTQVAGQVSGARAVRGKPGCGANSLRVTSPTKGQKKRDLDGRALRRSQKSGGSSALHARRKAIKLGRLLLAVRTYAEEFDYVGHLGVTTFLQHALHVFGEAKIDTLNLAT
jgi:hypothetical protein